MKKVNSAPFIKDLNNLENPNVINAIAKQYSTSTNQASEIGIKGKFSTYPWNTKNKGNNNKKEILINCLRVELLFIGGK